MRENLINFRKKLGLTQNEMAKMFNLTKGTWCNIEKGRNTGKAKMWIDLADKFKLSNEETKKLMEVSSNETT